MKKLIILIICFLVVLSCGNEDEDEKTYPVKYFLTGDHKKILEDYALNDFIAYVNKTKDTILFKADSLFTKLTYRLNEVRQGEELILYYTCQSDYLETFKIGYQLSAINDSNSQMILTTISGDLVHTERGQLFYASSAKFNIPFSTDSIFNSVDSTPFKYTDSLTFNSELLNSNYSFNKLESFGWGALSTYMVYNKEYGLIEFDTKDGNIWRQNIKKLH
jgi:hypothetical protein